MSRSIAAIALAILFVAPVTGRANTSAWGAAKSVVGKASTGKLEKEINRRLLDEGRKNQCSFKTDSDELAPGCDSKVRRLADVVIDAKKKLNAAGVENFKFVVSGHTDTSGSPAHNQELSAKRAAVIQRELVQRGVASADIESVGMGSKQPVVKPDDTAEKKAKNRRYEIQVKL